MDTFAQCNNNTDICLVGLSSPSAGAETSTAIFPETLTPCNDGLPVVLPKSFLNVGWPSSRICASKFGDAEIRDAIRVRGRIGDSVFSIFEWPIESEII
jgi:hypothetical protein